jgi:hypothetical protein
MSAPKIILPTVHMNGTSPGMLKEGYLEAYRAVKNAEAQLIGVEFNGRDYYPQGDAAWKKAREEHGARLEKLRGIADEIMAILEHVQEVIDAKERQSRG